MTTDSRLPTDVQPTQVQVRWPRSPTPEVATAEAVGQVVKGRWSIDRKHDIGPGDEAYLVRQAIKPRGIISAGVVTSAPYTDAHWEISGELSECVEVDWTRAVPFADPLRLGDLRHVSPKQHWEAQQSGIVLRPECTRAVADLWDAHVHKRRRW